jgi:hypothetical protein
MQVHQTAQRKRTTSQHFLQDLVTDWIATITVLESDLSNSYKVAYTVILFTGTLCFIVSAGYRLRNALKIRQHMHTLLEEQAFSHDDMRVQEKKYEWELKQSQRGSYGFSILRVLRALFTLEPLFPAGLTVCFLMIMTVVMEGVSCLATNRLTPCNLTVVRRQTCRWRFCHIFSCLSRTTEKIRYTGRLFNDRPPPRPLQLQWADACESVDSPSLCPIGCRFSSRCW